MWKSINGCLYLDINKVNRDEFNIKEQDGLRLIFPRKNKWEWKEEERNLRSIIVDENGKVVSSAWSKFGNYGEFRDDTDTLNAFLINEAPVHFTLKMDGSLCCRSVINGKVVLRTRGTMYGGEDQEEQIAFGKRFYKVAEEKYPIMLDPTWYVNCSLLFEYVSPDNVIVVNYDTEDLIFLGGVYHNDLTPIPYEVAQHIAKQHNLNLVKTATLPNKAKDILANIDEWKTEGVVARVGNVFVKIKSAWYMALHKLKAQMNYETIAEVCIKDNITNEIDLIKYCGEHSYDYELIVSATKLFQEYLVYRNMGEDLLKQGTEFVNNFQSSITKPVEPAKKRKEFAQLVCKESGVYKAMLFALYDNKIDQAKGFIEKIIYNKGIQ